MLRPNGWARVVRQGEVLHGIYRADESSIEVCFNPNGGAVPTSFADTHSTTWLFKRSAP
jgi:hypothetical protein